MANDELGYQGCLQNKIEVRRDFDALVGSGFEAVFQLMHDIRSGIPPIIGSLVANVFLAHPDEQTRTRHLSKFLDALRPGDRLSVKTAAFCGTMIGNFHVGVIYKLHARSAATKSAIEAIYEHCIWERRRVAEPKAHEWKQAGKAVRAALIADRGLVKDDADAPLTAAFKSTVNAAHTAATIADLGAAIASGECTGATIDAHGLVTSFLAANGISAAMPTSEKYREAMVADHLAKLLLLFLLPSPPFV